MTGRPRDPWSALGAHTAARIAIGRAGASLPTREVLSFALAHAVARDAVHAQVAWSALAAKIGALGLDTVEVASEAPDRATYLRRPDLGRRLDKPSRQRLGAIADTGKPFDLVLVVGDGLSATAIEAQAEPVIAAMQPLIARIGLTLAPVVLARGARVALGDEVGALLHARLVAVLIGERPGLSAADGISIYLSYDPHPGRTDAMRNCISNIRPGGLSAERAAHSAVWLVEAALAMKATGVMLKDRSDEEALDSQSAPPLSP